MAREAGWTLLRGVAATAALGTILAQRSAEPARRAGTWVAGEAAVVGRAARTAPSKLGSVVRTAAEPAVEVAEDIEETWRNTMGMIRNTIVFSAGYVLGARAGKERYYQLRDTANRLAQRPEVQQARERVVSTVSSKLPGRGRGGSGGMGSTDDMGAGGTSGLGTSRRRRRNRGQDVSPALTQVGDDSIIASSDLTIDLAAESETSSTQRPGTI